MSSSENKIASAARIAGASDDKSTDIEIRGGTIVTMDEARRIVVGSVFVRGDRIVGIGDVGNGNGGAPANFAASLVIDASGCVVAPGFVQAHTHVCQTLCRGGADDLPLLEWLRLRVWPHEAALDERAMRAAVRLAAAELLKGGTTAILDMGSVHESDALFDELGRSGIRAIGGKAMMDKGESEGVPARLVDTTRAAVDESDALSRRWARPDVHGGRLGYAYAPRFVLSCSRALLDEVSSRGRGANGARIHTHASEHPAEVALIRARLGDDNISFLRSLGLVGPHVTLAHCVQVDAREQRILADTGTHVAHCPSSNLKLGSGIAPIPELLALGVNVGLGADGAPCNNNLDAFLELRLAALLHKPRMGTHAMDAMTALSLATVGGARALGLGGQIGSLQIGHRADLIVVDLRAPHATPAPDPVSALVYAARVGDVRDVIVDGRVLVRNRRLTETSGLDEESVVRLGEEEARRIAGRAETLVA